MAASCVRRLCNSHTQVSGWLCSSWVWSAKEKLGLNVQISASPTCRWQQKAQSGPLRRAILGPMWRGRGFFRGMQEWPEGKGTWFMSGHGREGR